MTDDERNTVRTIGGISMDLRNPGLWSDANGRVTAEVAEAAGWPTVFWLQQRRMRLIMYAYSPQKYEELKGDRGIWPRPSDT